MVKKRTLLFLAALVWLAAGVNIMRIGVIAYSGHLTLLAAAGSVVVFVLFLAHVPRPCRQTHRPHP